VRAYIAPNIASFRLYDCGNVSSLFERNNVEDNNALKWRWSRATISSAQASCMLEWLRAQACSVMDFNRRRCGHGVLVVVHSLSSAKQAVFGYAGRGLGPGKAWL
jgi:hypothetical protein